MSGSQGADVGDVFSGRNVAQIAWIIIQYSAE